MSAASVLTLAFAIICGGLLVYLGLLQIADAIREASK